VGGVPRRRQRDKEGKEGRHRSRRLGREPQGEDVGCLGFAFEGREVDVIGLAPDAARRRAPGTERSGGVGRRKAPRVQQLLSPHPAQAQPAEDFARRPRAWMIERSRAAMKPSARTALNSDRRSRDNGGLSSVLITPGGLGYRDGARRPWRRRTRAMQVRWSGLRTCMRRRGGCRRPRASRSPRACPPSWCCGAAGSRSAITRSPTAFDAAPGRT
jgi:hypothetical protein